jgi:hypothetical protein
LSDYLWLPKDLSGSDALMVGYQPSDVAWMCTSAKVVAHLTVPYNVVSLEQGTPLTLCSLREPLPKVWGGLKNFS